MTKVTALMFLGLIFACQSFAQPIPDAPPVKTQEHRFLDTPNKVAIFSTIALRSTDAAITCHGLHQGFQEGGLPTQSCGAVIGYSAGFTAASVVSSYVLHKTHHHNLERLAAWAAAPASFVGIVQWSQVLRKKGGR
jgi:hypothetical protein